MKYVSFSLYFVDPTSNIYLSQRLSYECLSTYGRYTETVNSSLNQLCLLWVSQPLQLDYKFNHCLNLFFAFKLRFVSHCCTRSLSVLLAALLTFCPICKTVISCSNVQIKPPVKLLRLNILRKSHL